jgi:cell division control protein 7
VVRHLIFSSTRWLNVRCPAIDVWSAGMILLFFLAGKFPLLQSSDDIEALMEIATIIGRQKMEKTAILHSNYRI